MDISSRLLAALDALSSSPLPEWNSRPSGSFSPADADSRTEPLNNQPDGRPRSHTASTTNSIDVANDIKSDVFLRPTTINSGADLGAGHTVFVGRDAARKPSVPSSISSISRRDSWSSHPLTSDDEGRRPIVDAAAPRTIMPPFGAEARAEHELRGVLKSSRNGHGSGANGTDTLGPPHLPIPEATAGTTRVVRLPTKRAGNAPATLVPTTVPEAADVSLRIGARASRDNNDLLIGANRASVQVAAGLDEAMHALEYAARKARLLRAPTPPSDTVTSGSNVDPSGHMRASGYPSAEVHSRDSTRPLHSGFFRASLSPSRGRHSGGETAYQPVEYSRRNDAVNSSWHLPVEHTISSIESMETSYDDTEMSRIEQKVLRGRRKDAPSGTHARSKVDDSNTSFVTDYRSERTDASRALNRASHQPLSREHTASRRGSGSVEERRDAATGSSVETGGALTAAYARQHVQAARRNIIRARDGIYLDGSCTPTTPLPSPSHIQSQSADALSGTDRPATRVLPSPAPTADALRSSAINLLSLAGSSSSSAVYSSLRSSQAADTTSTLKYDPASKRRGPLEHGASLPPLTPSMLSHSTWVPYRSEPTVPLASASLVRASPIPLSLSGPVAHVEHQDAGRREHQENGVGSLSSSVHTAMQQALDTLAECRMRVQGALHSGRRGGVNTTSAATNGSSSESRAGPLGRSANAVAHPARSLEATSRGRHTESSLQQTRSNAESDRESEPVRETARMATSRLLTSAYHATPSKSTAHVLAPSQASHASPHRVSAGVLPTSLDSGMYSFEQFERSSAKNFLEGGVTDSLESTFTRGSSSRTASGLRASTTSSVDTYDEARGDTLTDTVVAALRSVYGDTITSPAQAKAFSFS